MSNNCRSPPHVSPPPTISHSLNYNAMLHRSCHLLPFQPILWNGCFPCERVNSRAKTAPGLLQISFRTPPFGGRREVTIRSVLITIHQISNWGSQIPLLVVTSTCPFRAQISQGLGPFLQIELSKTGRKLGGTTCLTLVYCLSNTASFVLCVSRRVRDHHHLLHWFVAFEEHLC